MYVLTLLLVTFLQFDMMVLTTWSSYYGCRIHNLRKSCILVCFHSSLSRYHFRIDVTIAYVLISRQGSFPRKFLPLVCCRYVLVYSFVYEVLKKLRLIDSHLENGSDRPTFLGKNINRHVLRPYEYCRYSFLLFIPKQYVCAWLEASLSNDRYWRKIVDNDVTKLAFDTASVVNQVIELWNKIHPSLPLPLSLFVCHFQVFHLSSKILVARKK